MANTFYVKAKEALLNADIDFLVDDIRIVLVDATDYTPDTDNDEFLSDVPAGARIATSDALSSKTTTGGVFDAADAEFDIPSGQDEFEYGVLYKHTGSDSTARLIALLDTATGLPFAPPSGGISVIVRWSGSGIIAVQ